MSRRKGIVLIVDDEEEIRESIEMLLNSEGLFTDTAADGEEGLKKIEENLYDAVLLDLMLPGRSGMEVQKDIRRIDPTLPVIIITAIGALETAVTAIKEGSFDYVTKPWNNEKLVVIVNNAVKQRQLMSEKRRANVVPIETAKAGEMAGARSTDSAEFDSTTLSSILSWIDIERIVDGDPDRKNARRNALIFKLHYIDGFESGEISRFPGFELTKSGVETILARLRKRIQQ